MFFVSFGTVISDVQQSSISGETAGTLGREALSLTWLGESSAAESSPRASRSDFGPVASEW